MKLPPISIDPLTRFKNLNTARSVQGPIGRKPTDFLSFLRRSGSKRSPGVAPVEKLYPSVLGRCCRDEVRRICLDPRVDLLEAYAVAMAWGGQREKHFKWSIREPALVKLLESLRSSNCGRAEDFGRARGFSRSIAGLGVSYWTKLLFFFRPIPDAYILDQWTAKSVAILVPGVVRLSGDLPSPGTTDDEYQAYCVAVEHLAADMGGDWTPGEVEMALFDRKGGHWRRWVKENFSTPGKTTNGDPDDDGHPISGLASEEEADIHALLDAIEAEHLSSASAGMPLPPGSFRRSASDTKRLRVGGERGDRSSDVMWFYKLTKKRMSAGVVFSKKAAHLLDSLTACNDQAPWFGAGITSSESRTITVELPRGDGLTPKATSAILVAAMSSLFSTVHSVARFAGINHPKL